MQIFLNKVTQAKLFKCAARYENPKTQWEKGWERIPQPMRSHNLWRLKVKKKSKIKVDSSRAEMNILQL